MTDKSRLLADGMGHQNHAQKLSLLHVRAMHIDTHKHQAEKWMHEVLLTMPMEQQAVTNPAVIHGLCAMTKHSEINTALLT